VDTLAPAFNEALPGDITVDCHAVPAADILTATDLCQDVDVTFTEDTTSGSCPDAYTLTRSWSTSDDCGNTASHTQVVTVQDTIAPSIDTPAMDLTVECDGAGNIFDYLNWQTGLAGAAASSLIFGRFAWQSFESPAQTGRYALGALLMGLGGVLAGGCTLGAGLSGIPTLGFAAFLALAAIIAGAKIAGRVLNESGSGYGAQPSTQALQPAE